MNYMLRKLLNLTKNFLPRTVPTESTPKKNHTLSVSDKSADRRWQGDFGELLVVRWLEGRGYTLLERGYRTRFGEIDIIVSRDSVVAFVEVKLRNHHYFDLS